MGRPYQLSLVGLNLEFSSKNSGKNGTLAFVLLCGGTWPLGKQSPTAATRVWTSVQQYKHD